MFHLTAINNFDRQRRTIAGGFASEQDALDWFYKNNFSSHCSDPETHPGHAPVKLPSEQLYILVSPSGAIGQGHQGANPHLYKKRDAVSVARSLNRRYGHHSYYGRWRILPVNLDLGPDLDYTD